jgi:hypothetical protein
MTGRPLERRVKLTDRLAAKGSRKLLAIDGAGIRGVLSLMIHDKIEKLLIEEVSEGASTGGIIAAGIAMRMSVTEILAFYVDNGCACRKLNPRILEMLSCACRKSSPNILVVQPAQDRAAKNGPG